MSPAKFELGGTQYTLSPQKMINIMVKYHTPMKTEQGKLNCYPIKRAQISKTGSLHSPPIPLSPQLFGTSYAPAYHELCQIYYSYIAKNYGTKVTVVFDGYQSGPGTKDATHLCRGAKHSQNILFEPEMKFIGTKDVFWLMNQTNKDS